MMASTAVSPGMSTNATSSQAEKTGSSGKFSPTSNAAKINSMTSSYIQSLSKSLHFES